MRDNKIVCPHCYEEYEPSYEDTWISEQNIECYENTYQVATCEKCHKKFSILPFEDWMYETEEVDE